MAAVSACRGRSRCDAVLIFGRGHFSWQVQGKPHVLVVQSRLFVTGAKDRSGFALRCIFRGRCSALDMAVIVPADFVAGKVLCEPRSEIS